MQRHPSTVLGLLSVFVTLAALAMGCGPSGAQTGSTPGSDTSARGPSGEASIALASFNAETWDPSQTLPFMTQLGGPLYESLYLYTPPKGELKTLLLDKAEMAPDARSWTFKLKSGIRFSNGDPMTADDVKFSLDRYRSDASKTSQAAAFQRTIQDVKVVDPLTVRVEFKEPWLTINYFLGGLTGNEGIVLPKKYIEQVGWEAFDKKGIGSGPYKVAEQTLGDSVTYEAVQDHWRAVPRFNKVRYLLVPEERTRIAMVRTGQANLVARVSADNKKELERDGFTSLVVPNGAQESIRFFGAYGSYPDHPLKKLEVRKALTYAINKKEIVDKLHGGLGEVAQYLLSFPNFTLGAPSGLAPTPYDPEEAKRLLQQAGYPGGFELVIYVPSSCPTGRTLAEAVTGSWEKINVRAQVRPIDFPVFRPFYAGKEHSREAIGNAYAWCQAGSPLGVRDLQNAYWSKGIVKETDVADAEIEKASVATSNEELVTYTEAAFKKVYENYAGIPIANIGLVWVADKNLADMPTAPTWENFGSFLTRDKP